MNKELSETEGNFTWGWGCEYFIETEVLGNFEWSNPEYPGGTGEIKVFNGNYADWVEEMGIPYGRDKGTHKIGTFISLYQPLVRKGI